MFSTFLSDFESFINCTELVELENIAGHPLIKEIGNKESQKLQFLNQGVNSKELVLFFLQNYMENIENHLFDHDRDVSIELIELFKQASHLRIRWKVNSSDKKLNLITEQGNKRQCRLPGRR